MYSNNKDVSDPKKKIFIPFVQNNTSPKELMDFFSEYSPVDCFIKNGRATIAFKTSSNALNALEKNNHFYRGRPIKVVPYQTYDQRKNGKDSPSFRNLSASRNVTPKHEPQTQYNDEETPQLVIYLYDTRQPDFPEVKTKIEGFRDRILNKTNIENIELKIDFGFSMKDMITETKCRRIPYLLYIDQKDIKQGSFTLYYIYGNGKFSHINLSSHL